MGRLLLTFLGGFAEFERDLIKERTLSGKRYKAKTMARWPGGTKPYGYAYYKGEPGEDGRWEIIEEEAATVRRIYQMCVRDDFGISIIADRLSGEGVPTPSAVIADPDHPRAKPNLRVGRKWERSHIARILHNPTYMGMLLIAVDGERKDTALNKMAHLIETGKWREMGLLELRVPAVVDDSLWWAAQAKLEARRRLPNPHYQTWPLQGRVVCAVDGRVFKCHRSGKQGSRTYSCSGREGRARLDGSSRCTAPRLDAGLLEAAVVSHLNGAMTNPRTGKKAVEDYLSKLELLQEEATTGLAPILHQLEESRGKEKRLDDLYAWGRVSREEYEARLHEVLSGRRALEDERSNRQREIDEFETRQKEIEQIRAAIADERFTAAWRPRIRSLSIALRKERDDFSEGFDEWMDELAAQPTGELQEEAPPAPGRDNDVTSLTKKTRQWGNVFLDNEGPCFESPLEMRRLFDLFDVRVVVYSDTVEVQGIFARSLELRKDWGAPLHGEKASLSRSRWLTSRS